jgi:hypothetical protein
VDEDGTITDLLLKLCKTAPDQRFLTQVATLFKAAKTDAFDQLRNRPDDDGSGRIENMKDFLCEFVSDKANAASDEEVRDLLELPEFQKTNGVPMELDGDEPSCDTNCKTCEHDHERVDDKNYGHIDNPGWLKRDSWQGLKCWGCGLSIDRGTYKPKPFGFYVCKSFALRQHVACKATGVLCSSCYTQRFTADEGRSTRTRRTAS